MDQSNTAVRVCVSPHETYARRVEELAATEQRLARRIRRVRKASNVVFGALIVFGLLTEHEAVAVKLMILGPELIVFAMLESWRTRLGMFRRRAEDEMDYIARGLARLDGNWAGTGTDGTRYRPTEHPYAEDLDLFGTGSLYELLCAARTRPGQDALAVWLLGPAPPEEVRRRQAAVAELAPNLDLRIRLDRLAAEELAPVDLMALARWAADPPALNGRERFTALALTAVFVGAAVGWLVELVGPEWVFIAFVVQAVYAVLFRNRYRDAFAAVEQRAFDAATVIDSVSVLAAERFRCEHLVRIQADLTGKLPAGVGGLIRTGRLIRSNRLLAIPMAITAATYPAAEYVLRRAGEGLLRRLRAWGELEALGSLAVFAFENPDHPFPALTEGAAVFHADGLGHPLLPIDRCVRNDVSLDSGLSLLVVSGSNMSGKSTFLRTVGINAVMAQAGSVVRAKRLTLSALAVGACLVVRDSLRDGRSRFYAELLRVQQILETAGGPTRVLFLFDEFLQGTNSHDRRVGAEAVVRALLDRGAVGLLTTHDLTLTEIADALAPRAANVHFADQFDNGDMTFDYRMHAGVVRRSNALALMRSLGIKV